MEKQAKNVHESTLKSKKELTTAKSILTREINSYKKEIAWITRNDTNGLPISKWYLGELRVPQLRKLKRELNTLLQNRIILDQMDYPERLGKLMIRTWGVSETFVHQLLEKYCVAIASCALNEISLKDALVAIYKLSN